MWTHDVRQALRLFRREPGFAAAAVLTLALGVGATTALFVVVSAVRLQPLPFERADDLVVLRHRDVQTGLTKPDIAIGDFVDLRARQRSLESLAGFGGFQSALLGDGEPRRVEGAAATPDALRALRVTPALGRVLQDDDARVYGLGRLRPGMTTAQAATEFAALSRELEVAFLQQNRGSRYEALSLRDSLVGETRRPLLLLFAAGAFVLLIACANVGNLLLARALGRQQDLAIRLALGAGRARLVTQVLAEGLALALAGGLLGVIAAWRAVPVLVALTPNASSLPGLDRAGVTADVLLFALAASLTSALVFSAIACVGLFRARGAGVPGQRQGTMAPGTRIAASGLVAAEIALSLMLLAGAGLTLRSFSNLLAVDPGFSADGVVTVQLALPAGRYNEDQARRAFYDRAFDDIRAVPNVETVGAAMVTPLTGNNWTAPLQRVDRPLPAGERPPEVGWQLASAGYFRALRIPLRSGRLFEPRDATGPAVVIISEATAPRFFAGENPLGHRLSLGDPGACGIPGLPGLQDSRIEILGI